MRIGLQKTSLIDFPGRLAMVFFLPGCNLRCPYCHNADLVLNPASLDPEDGRVSLDEALSYLKKRSGMIEGLVISGGEPTLHSELQAIVREAKKLGYAVKLDTNGFFPERIPLDLDYIAMDIKTDLYGYSGFPGSDMDAGKKIVAAMEKIRSYGCPYEFRTTLAPGFLGLSCAMNIAKLLKDEDDYILQRYRPGEGLDPSYPGDLKLDQEPEAILKEMLSLHGKTRLR